ncbi:hypothetical protein M9458_029417, partial [Cirrhinus mrigala]
MTRLHRHIHPVSRVMEVSSPAIHSRHHKTQKLSRTLRLHNKILQRNRTLNPKSKLRLLQHENITRNKLVLLPIQ